MKKIILITALTFLVGCSDMRRKCHLYCDYKDQYSSIVYCDSFQMHGLTKADVWIDGTKMSIEAEFIRPNISPRK